MRDLDLRSGRRALLVLLVIDGAVMVLHVVQRIVSERGDEQALLAGTRLSLSTDHGLGEVFGYGKTALVVALLLLIWRASGRPGLVFLGWAIMFTTILLDDSLQLHEAGGRVVARRLDLELLGLGRLQVGELVTWGLLSVVPLLLVAVLHRASPRLARQRSLVLAGLVGALIFFGAGVDTLHQAVEERDTVAWLVGSVEDGGELLVLSLIAAYAVAVAGSGVGFGRAPARGARRWRVMDHTTDDAEPATSRSI